MSVSQTCWGSSAFSAPTGPVNFAQALTTPGTNLGEGFWTTTIGLTMIHQYDPVALFWGFGYRHRFQNEFDGGITINPGKQAFYRAGAAFAVNQNVSFSATFLGSYIGHNTVNDFRIPGSSLEPLQMRLAATIAKPEKCHHGNCLTGHCSTGHCEGADKKNRKTMEPFVNFGLTEAAIDAVFGVTWTY